MSGVRQPTRPEPMGVGLPTEVEERLAECFELTCDEERGALVDALCREHPDHAATGRVARRAWVLAGLKNALPDLGKPFV